MPSKVQLQVELVEKNAEARLKALDKLAQEMGNRKITLNFDEASLARWKTASDGMTNAQLSAYAKLATASENASAKIIAAGQRTTQEEMKQNAKLVTERQKSFDKKVQLYEKEDTKRRQAAEKTAQAEINANAKVQVAAMKGADATRTQTSAQKELNAEASKTSGIFDSITKRFTAANLISTLITTGISKLRQSLREAVDELKEMDKQLTTIKMVSGASDSDIRNLTQQVYSGAREMGRSVTDYLSAAEMFTRAGYRENIDQLSKLALLTQNVGGVEEDTASKFLLAADAAWKLNGSYDALMGVLDGVSSVADQNATDLGKIAEGITIAGSAMANAGVGAQQFTAMLGVTTASTQRSGSEMARGLRTILFRVRQVKAEFEDGEIVDTEGISKAADALNNIAKIDVLDDNKQLKSFTQIMGELAEVWPKLDSLQRSNLQEALAGNRQGNVLLSWMDNWGAYEKMLQQYEESTGTALQKNAEYTDSWAAATNNLKTSWTEFVGVMTANGGALQWITERLTEIVDKSSLFVKDFRDAWDFSGIEWDSTAKRFKRVEKSAEDTGKKAEEAIPELVDYSESVTGAGEAAEDSTEKLDALTSAFQKQATAIDNVKKAIKEERDDAVNSMADIYKAMNEAAEKGYYGSNAFREGGALFFSEEVLDDIRNGKKNPIKEAMDAYMEGIAEGDYSTAAANLWKAVTDGTNELRDKNGDLIASVRDVGDAYEWTFDKGDKTTGEFLKTLSGGTGISEEFWASMISSLGMYSDELDEWSKDVEKATDDETSEPITTTAEFDGEQASSDIGDYVENDIGSIPKEVTTVANFEVHGTPMLPEYRKQWDDDSEYKTILKSVVKSQRDGINLTNKLKGRTAPSYEQPETITAEVEVKADTGQAESAVEALEKEIESTHPVITVTTVFESTGGGASTGGTRSGGGGLPQTLYDPLNGLIGRQGVFKAGGKRDNYSGIAIVNDQSPANGSTPELIISPSTRSAYIANGGKPAIVNLRSDDIVLNAQETRDAIGVPGFPLGKAFLPEMTFEGGGTGTLTTPKSGSTTTTGGGSSKKKSADPSETWATLKKLIDYLLDKGKEDLDEQLKVLDDQLAELEAERKAAQESKKLEEKQLAVQEAQLDLEKAQTERTVRYYNEETQQWEWMADQKAVQDAQEAYEKALEDLNEYLEEQDYEERKAAIEAQKEDLKAQYEAYEKSWQDIVDIIEAPEGDLKALLEELKKSGTDTMKGQVSTIGDLLNLLREGIVSGGYALGLGRIGDNTEKTGTTIATTFDGGGLAYGLGYMNKRTVGTEAVLGPDITADILNPVKNARFTAFAESVGSLMGGGVMFPKSQEITNNSGGNIIVNGMRIGSDQMSKPFGQVMKTLAIHVNEHS